MIENLCKKIYETEYPKKILNIQTMINRFYPIEKFTMVCFLILIWGLFEETQLDKIEIKSIDIKTFDIIAERMNIAIGVLPTISKYVEENSGSIKENSGSISNTGSTKIRFNNKKNIHLLINNEDYVIKFIH